MTSISEIQGRMEESAEGLILGDYKLFHEDDLQEVLLHKVRQAGYEVLVELTPKDELYSTAAEVLKARKAFLEDSNKQEGKV